MEVRDLPALNATLNSISAMLLLFGYYFIKRKEIDRHRLCMVLAFITSCVFLGSYLVYHYYAGSVPFQGQGWIRSVYFAILITHIVLAAAVPVCHVLVNNAGGAIGTDRVEDADLEDWRWMYEVNVLGLVRVTQALLPALRASADGVIVNVGSTAGRWAYEGGGGYTSAKHAVKVVSETLRLELNGEPIRITEVAPGMVRTDEFSVNRFGGDQARADAVYAGVEQPLLAEDVADAIAWVATRPSHVDIDELVIKPRAQAAAHKVHRT